MKSPLEKILVLCFGIFLAACTPQSPSSDPEISVGFETGSLRLVVTLDLGVKATRTQNLNSSFEIYAGHDYLSMDLLDSLLDSNHSYAIRTYVESEDETSEVFEQFSLLNDFPNFDVWGCTHSSIPDVYDIVKVNYKNHFDLNIDFAEVSSINVMKGWVYFGIVCLNTNDHSFVDRIVDKTLVGKFPSRAFHFEIKDNSQIEFCVAYERSSNN